MKSSASVGLIIVIAFAAGFASGGGFRADSADAPEGAGGTSARSVDTDSLVTDFYRAWNGEDMAGMLARLQPTAFFRSPYQLRYGRDTMQATVLVTNPPRFKNVETTEWHSFSTDGLAWSIGELHSEIHDDRGVSTGEAGGSEYLHVFTPADDGTWKVQMLVYHEPCS